MKLRPYLIPALLTLTLPATLASTGCNKAGGNALTAEDRKRLSGPPPSAPTEAGRKQIEADRLKMEERMRQQAGKPSGGPPPGSVPAPPAR
jgi:hypothetical protein